ncbi:GntR family transcriptional regulator [Pedococcus sp. NPDC057267]|uniref:GntR family transcriptional regulator n=1 Tax=Pedococcus sp. NPDC057267 TaxID=3346077 RepID=UPI00363088DF
MSRPLVTIDPAVADPPFEQVRAQVAQRIADGDLREGDHLPTVRSLAAEIGLAVNTVARAYKQLEADGLVTTGRRAGTVVAPGALATDIALGRSAADFAGRAVSAGLGDTEALDLVRTALREARG